MKQKTSVSGSLSNKRQLTDSEINNGFSFNSVLESPSLNGQLYQMDEQLDSISKELCNFLIDKGVTPVSSNNNQLKTLLNTLFDAKQNSLVAGSNITIDENGVISATSAEAANIPLFTSIQLYCKAFNTSWVNASNYSWLYGSMYKSAYNFLKNQAYPSAVAVRGTNYYILNWSDKSTESTTVLANSGTVQDLINYANSKGYDIIDSETIASFKCEKTISDSSETINEIDISFKRTFSDMKIIVDDENVSKAEQIYSAIGIQNYFILDVENQRFKLPRTTRGFEGIRTKVGDYITETLPNIEGKVGSWYGQNTRVPDVSSGPFYDMVVEQQNGSGSGSGSMLAYSQKFDASRVSDAYVNGAKVQPNATQMYLYFYLGETGNVVDHEIASQTLETINNKADIDLNNISEAAKQMLRNINLVDYDDYIDITPQTSGETLEMPADGELNWAAKFSSRDGFISTELVKNGVRWNKNQVSSGYSSLYAGFTIKVQKGDIIRFYYANVAETLHCRLFKYKSF